MNTSTKATSIVISSELIDRINEYLKSPVAVAKTKREFFEMSIVEFLDREEIIKAKLEREFLRIRQQFR